MNAYRFLATLLAALTLASTAGGQTEEVLSFTQGTTPEYSTKGHPKAAGLHLTLRYPSTWRAAEGDRPHVVQKFVSSEGSGMEMCALVVVATAEPASEADVKAAFEPDVLPEYVPSEGTFISAQQTKLDGIPGGVIAYKLPVQSAGQTGMVYLSTYMTVFDSKWIQVHCSVGGLHDSKTLEQRFEDYSGSVFTLIANSLVVQDQWVTISAEAMSAVRQELGIETPESVYLSDLFQSDRPMFYRFLVINWVVIFGLGLIPAFVARYAIYKRPLPKKSANWIAGVFCLIFVVLFIAIGAATGHRSNPFIWLVVFLVSRWIMTSGEGSASLDAVDAESVPEDYKGEIPFSQLIDPIPAEKYAEKKGISELELQRKIKEGEVSASFSDGQLWVENRHER